MDLKSWKIVVFLLIVWESSKNKTELLIFKLFPRIVIKDDDRPIVLFLKNTGFFDKLQLFFWKFIHKTLKVGFHSFFLVAKNEKIVFVFIFQVLELNNDELIANSNRIEIFDHKMFIMNSVECDTLLLNCYHEFVLYD